MGLLAYGKDDFHHTLPPQSHKIRSKRMEELQYE